MRKKTFVLDTSVLVHHEDSIHAFPDQKVIIPMVVLEEIDNLKTRSDSVGNSARYVNRFLDELRGKGSLASGVKLDNGQEIHVYTELKKDDLIPLGHLHKNRLYPQSLLLQQRLQYKRPFFGLWLYFYCNFQN